MAGDAGQPRWPASRRASATYRSPGATRFQRRACRHPPAGV